jgi:hypothetical protein
VGAGLVSQLGTRVSFLAVPLPAVSTLHASALAWGASWAAFWATWWACGPCCGPSAVIVALSALWFLLSPLRSMRDPPEPAP